jgi:hypothetical protein
MKLFFTVLFLSGALFANFDIPCGEIAFSMLNKNFSHDIKSGKNLSSLGVSEITKDGSLYRFYNPSSGWDFNFVIEETELGCTVINKTRKSFFKKAKSKPVFIIVKVNATVDSIEMDWQDTQKPQYINILSYYRY